MPTLDELVEMIKSLQIQGANEIALSGLYYLKKLAKEKGFGKDFNAAMNALENTRPTAVVLHNCLELLSKEKNMETINNLINQIKSSSEKIAKNFVKNVKDGYTILTHCHSGVAVAALKAAARDHNYKIKVYATETEPKLQGVKTARELAEAGVDVTLIPDSAVGFFMQDIDMVVLGSDAMRQEGNINKIGSYTIALVAAAHKVPYFVLGSTLKLDRRKNFTIEERPPSEVYSELSALRGASVRNPAFDLTPWKYITRVVTEYGTMTPGNILKLLKEKP